MQNDKSLRLSIELTIITTNQWKTKIINTNNKGNEMTILSGVIQLAFGGIDYKNELRYVNLIMKIEDWKESSIIKKQR